MQDHGKPRADMHAPHFKWEWSINTIAIIFGLLAGVAGWGYMLNEVQGSLEDHREKIAEIQADVKRIDSADRRLENHEIRISNVESLAGSASNAARSLEQSINALTSDLRLNSEILQRLERQRSRRWRSGGRTHDDDGNGTP